MPRVSLYGAPDRKSNDCTEARLTQGEELREWSRVEDLSGPNLISLILRDIRDEIRYG